MSRVNRVLLLAVALLAPASLLHAQDTRTVTEPTLPDPDADHPLGLTLDNVIFDQIQSSDITGSEANITFGPGPVNLPSFTGTDLRRERLARALARWI